MGVLDKYLKLPTTKQTTTKNVYDTVVSIVNKEEEKKALQNIQAELENKTALFPKKPGNYDEMIANDNYNSEYKKVRTELGIDILNANLEKHIAEKLAEGTGIDEYKENLARVEIAPQFEKMRTQLEKNEAQIISRIGKEKYIELYNEIDSKTRNESKQTNTGADFEYGKMQIESSLAWNDYLNSGLYLDKARAIAKDEELNKYYNEHYKELGNSIFSGTAEYLPQAGYQIEHNAPAFIVGGIAGGVAGIVSKNPKIGLKTGQVVTGIGSAITSSTASYDLIRGGVYRDLVKMGVDENIAKDISADSAFWQSVIEGIETGVSIFNLFKNPATSGAKKTIKEYLKGYGINIITEGLEEGSQEIVGIAYEKSALEKSGLDTSGYDIWNNITRVGEATLGGMEIAVTIGGAQTGLIMGADSVSKVKTKNDIKKNITNYYDNEIKKNKGNEVKISELQKAKEQATSDKNVTEVFNFIMSEEGQRIIKEQQDSAKKVQTTYKNQKNNQEFLNSLQEELRGTTDPNAEIKVENSISKMHANAKTQVERITKGEYEVVYYSSNNLEATLELNEAINEKAGKKIFVNSNMNAKDTYAVIGHGLGHFIISKNPDILTEFKKKITAEQLKTYNETLGYQIGTETDTPEVRETKVLEELFGDYLGELFAREDVVKKFEKQTMTAGEKIIDVGKNIIANTTGVDTRSKVSTYNMNQTSRLQGNIIKDKDFENQILKILSDGSKPTNPQVEVKLEKKTTSLNKEVLEQDLSELQIKYDEMKKADKKQLEIKKMIAKELGIEKYDSFKRNPEVEDKYRELKQNYEERMMYSNDEGTKFSKKIKNVDINKEKLYNSENIDWEKGERGKVVSAINSDMPTAPIGRNYKFFNKNFYYFEKIEFNEYKFLEKLEIGNEMIQLIIEEVENERKTVDGRGKASDSLSNYRRSNEIGVRNSSNGFDSRERTTNRNDRISTRRTQKNRETSKRGTTNTDESIRDTSTKFSKKVDKDKALAIEMNAKRTTRKPLNKKLDTAKDKLAQEKARSKKNQQETLLKVRWTSAKKYRAKEVKKNMTRNRRIQDELYSKGYSKEAIVERAKKDQMIESIRNQIAEEKAMKEIMKSIRTKLKKLFSPKLYNKLDNHWKAKVDEFESIYTGGNTKRPTTWIKEMVKLISKEMAERPDIIVSDKVLKAIENPEQITLVSYGDKEDLEYLESLIDDLMNDIADMFIFRGANIDLESTKNEVANEVAKLAIPKIQKEDMIAYRRSIREAKLAGKFINNLEDIKRGVKGVGSKYLETMSTFHTLLLTMTEGNTESPLFILEKFLQQGNMREKEAELEMMEALTSIREKNKFGNEKFNKQLMKMLDRKSEWIDVGIQYEDSNGYERTLQLPKSMILSLAMHAKNNDNLKHITGQLVEVRANKDGAIELLSREGGGIVVPNKQYYQRGKLKEAYTYGKKLKLTVDDVNQIISTLKEEELAFLDVVEEFYKVSTNLINKTSNKLLGYDLATVVNYFPIRVSTDSLNRSRDLEEKKGLLSANQLLNAFDITNNFGFLKERNSKAFEPILLENIAEVMTRSLDGVSKYYGYATALYDNNLLLNTKLREPIKVGSVEYNNIRELMGKINPSFEQVYNKLTTFMVGAQDVRMSALESKIRTLHAHATFKANIGSWLKNFGALTSTLKYHTVSESIRSALPHNSKVKVDEKIRKYYEGLGNDTTGKSKRDLLRSFIAQATPELDYRRLGYRIPEARDLYRNKNIFQRMDFVQGMSMVENLSITAIARMETFILSLDESLEFGSDEFIERLGDRINEIVRQTQQVNSQINKANIARDSNILSRAFTFYSSDSMQLFNNVVNSALELSYANKTGDKAKMKKAWFKMNKTAIGLVLNFATIELISRTIQGHDDDDELFDEDYLISMLINMLSPTLFLDDIAIAVMALIDSSSYYSFDITLPELDFVNSIIDLGSKITALITGTTEEHKRPKAWVDVIKDLGTVTGIPSRDLLKWFTGLLKFADSDAYKKYSLYVTPNAYKKWLENTDMGKAELYEVYEATREKKLISDFGYVKKSQKESEQKKQAMKRAIQSVTTDSKKIKEYMEIFGGYKS